MHLRKPSFLLERVCRRKHLVIYRSPNAAKHVFGLHASKAVV